MDITITGRHLEITPSIKSYIEEKMSRLDKLSASIISAHAIVCHEKYRFSVEVVLKGNHLDISAKEETTDLHGAVDMVFSKIQKRIRRYGDIIKEKHRGGRVARKAKVYDYEE